MHWHYIETSRGCPFPCKFCWRIGEKRLRHRSIDSIIEDIKERIQFFKSKYFLVTDSSFGVDRQWTKELLKRTIEERLKIKMIVFCRCNEGEDKELLKLMKETGVFWVYLGIESINSKILEDFDKCQNINIIIKAIKNFQTYGFKIVGGFILGSDYDTVYTCQEVVKFSLKLGLDRIAINVLTEFPSEKEKLIFTHQLFQKNLDYYTVAFVTSFPSRIKPSQLQLEIYKGYKYFNSTKEIFKVLIRRGFWEAAERLFQRFENRYLLKSMKKYILILKSLEQCYYNENDRFIESIEGVNNVREISQSASSI